MPFSLEKGTAKYESISSNLLNAPSRPIEADKPITPTAFASSQQSIDVDQGRSIAVVPIASRPPPPKPAGSMLSVAPMPPSFKSTAVLTPTVAPKPPPPKPNIAALPPHVPTTMPPMPSNIKSHIPLAQPLINATFPISGSENLSQSMLPNVRPKPPGLVLESATIPQTNSVASELAAAKAEMEAAIKSQRFELCAALRDKIILLENSLKLQSTPAPVLDIQAIGDYKQRLDAALANCIAAFKFEKCVCYRDRKQALVNLESEFESADISLKQDLMQKAVNLLTEPIED